MKSAPSVPPPPPEQPKLRARETSPGLHTSEPRTLDKWFTIAQGPAELEPLELQLKQLLRQQPRPLAGEPTLKASVDAEEKALAGLRSQARQAAERARKLERIRVAECSMKKSINMHDASEGTHLRTEATRLSEMLGSIAATDDAVTRIEDA